MRSLSVPGIWVKSVCAIGILAGISCSGDEVDHEEPVLKENLEVTQEATGSLSVDGKSYTLVTGELEDWGTEHEGSRQYAIDLYSKNYDPFVAGSVKLGIYLNSPSLTSLTAGTYHFEAEDTAPGGIMSGGVSMSTGGYIFVGGWIEVQKEGDIYSLKWEMDGLEVETEEEYQITGEFTGPLSFWGVDQ